MFEAIAAAYPRTIGALRARGMSRADAAGLILAARYGERALAWSTADCAKARAIIAEAFTARASRLRLSVEG